MHDFITGLQFLTRIKIANQSEWKPDSFGKSVKFFPIIGAIIGMVLVAIYYILDGYLLIIGIHFPQNVLATILTAVPILLTGGLHCDGFMDTMDGLFSGRSRERKLEIMKDSRVGANGVTAFILLILLKWSLINDIAPSVLPMALFSMPIVGRYAMVIGITAFPYARPDGMGKAFATYASKKSLIISSIFTILLLCPLGIKVLLSVPLAIFFIILFARYATNILGGLTGDLYGAITELAEVALLAVFLF